jgi:hypothetical protein
MSFNYSALRDNTVEPLMTRFGKPGVITAPTGAPADPWNPATGETTTNVTVVETQPDITERGGTLIEEGDVIFLVSPEGDPSLDLAQTLEVEGVVYRVVGIMPVRPGPVAMLWKAHCRR